MQPTAPSVHITVPANHGHFFPRPKAARELIGPSERNARDHAVERHRPCVEHVDQPVAGKIGSAVAGAFEHRGDIARADRFQFIDGPALRPLDLTVDGQGPVLGFRFREHRHPPGIAHEQQIDRCDALVEQFRRRFGIEFPRRKNA
jgi:hypothetical protein